MLQHPVESVVYTSSAQSCHSVGCMGSAIGWIWLVGSVCHKGPAQWGPNLAKLGTKSDSNLATQGQKTGDGIACPQSWYAGKVGQGQEQGLEAAWPDLDMSGLGPALIPLHSNGPCGVASGCMEFPPVPCCQIFQPVGIPVGWMSWLHGLDLACCLRIKHPWSTQCTAVLHRDTQVNSYWTSLGTRSRLAIISWTSRQANLPCLLVATLLPAPEVITLTFAWVSMCSTTVYCVDEPEVASKDGKKKKKNHLMIS